jgi:ATP-binding cassette subfamily B protein
MKIVKNNLTMLKMVWGISPSYIVGVVFSEIISAFLVVAGLLINRFIINTLMDEAVSFKSIAFSFILYLVIDFILSGFSIFLANAFHNLKFIGVCAELKNRLLNKATEVDISAYENTEFYNDYNRALNEINSRAAGVVQNIGLILKYILTTILITSVVFEINFLFGAIILSAAYFIYTASIDKIDYKLTNELTPFERKMGYMGHVFSEKPLAQESRTYGAKNFFIRKNEQVWKRHVDITKYHLKKASFLGNVYSLFKNIIRIIAAIYVSQGIIAKRITAGDFMFVLESFYAFNKNLTDLLSLSLSFKDNSQYIDCILKVLNYKAEIPENPGGEKIKSYERMNIEFRDVTFSYPNTPEETVLKNISLSINEGMKIAIVGDNGSGKSTFVKLLLYLYNPQTGIITCNNKDYAKYNTSNLRSAFGVVFQDYQIYLVTIAENVMMRAVSEEDNNAVWEALEFSELAEKVQQMEKGINSECLKIIDEDGVYLSNGQIQKLAIARAYAKKSRILVFDEPSSALDPVAEHDLFKKLLELGENKTVIYVSHRLSSVVDADKIVLFDSGEIKESGTHRELMALKGKYYSMFSVQAEKYQLQGGQ